MDLEEIVKKVTDAFEDKKGIDIKCLNVGNISSVADYFIIVSGSSNSQLDALCDIGEETMRNVDYKLIGREGRSESGWILLDYGDIVIHIFSTEMREFYNLDHTWKSL